MIGLWLHFVYFGTFQNDNRKASFRVKSADKMVMLPTLFDGTNLQYKRFNQYVKFQTKNGNITDPTEEAVELFKHTFDKKALVWFQEHRDNIKNNVLTKI